MKADICRNRHRGNPQSEAANDSVNKSRESKRVLAFLSFRGPLIAETIALDMRLPISSVAARLSELKRDGYVEETGQRVATTTGRLAAVVRVVPESLREKRKRQPALFDL